MIIELQLKLQKKYPRIFQDLGGDPKLTCIAWGIDVGNGWYDLVDNGCQKIMDANPSIDFKALQIKEKFGGLRFDVGTASIQIHDIIEEMEQESYKICEKCGSTENVTSEGRWILTLCKDCRENEG
jgi:hypothetical protein